MRHKNRDAGIRRKMQTKLISEFLRQVMPDTANFNRTLHSPVPELAKQFIVPKVELSMPLQKKIKKTRPSPILSTSKELFYETPKQGFIPGIGDDDDDDVTEEKVAQTEEENVGTVARPPTADVFRYTIRYP